MCVSAGLIEGGAQIAQGISDYQGSKVQAKALQEQGRQSIMASNRDASAIRAEGERVEGTNRAATAAAGVDLGSASSQAIAMEGAENVQQDVDLALYRGRVTATELTNQARMVRRPGRASLINSGMKAYSPIKREVDNW